MTDTLWDDQKVDELKRHWKSGLSSREIAAEMHVTRNTVCGKVARLGLEPREPRVPRKNEAQKQKTKLAANARHTENQRNRRAQMRGENLPPLPRPKIAPFSGSLEIPFRDLRDFRRSDPNQCRFIAGDSDPFFACGNPTGHGDSYCGHHKGIIYNPAAVKMRGPAEASA